jgi:misacylated tRNA(Ala) deacylase
MTEALYLKDSYVKEFKAKVTKVEGNKIYLDQTYFYPVGGGQPFDTGTLTANGTTYEIVAVTKTELGIAHETTQEGLKEGDEVEGKLNWERRYTLMRMHTASHCLSTTIHDKTGALITGHSIKPEKSHVDFCLEDFDKEKMTQYVQECNEKMSQGAEVSYSWMKREEALQDPTLVKLANVLPPEVNELRIVTIENIDRQADGGTHVKNTKEIGTIEILKFENKGKGRKRIYFTLTT